MQTGCKLNSSGCGMYANFKPSPVPISPSWTAYSYNSEFISLSASLSWEWGKKNGKWSKVNLLPQALFLPRDLATPGSEDGQARWGTGRCGICEKPHGQWAPEAFCVTQQTGESLRVAIPTWKAPWTRSCPAAPCSSSPEGTPEQGEALQLLCPSHPLLTALPLPSDRSHFPTAQIAFISISPRFSMQSVSLFSSSNVRWQIPWRTLSHLYLEGIFFFYVAKT